MVDLDQVVATLTAGGQSITFGDVDDFDVEWTLSALDGWFGGTASTARPLQRSRQSGAWLGKGYATGRSVAAEGNVYARTPRALVEAFDRLNEVCPVDGEAVLTISEPGRERWIPVRRSDDILADHYTSVAGRWSFQVFSEEWRKLGAQVQDATTLPSTSGGLLVPVTISFTIDAKTVTGQLSLTNPGNAPGPVVLRIDGPVQGPVITHVSSGAQLVFSSSIVIGAGEFLLVDMDARTVLANGQASRAGWITSRGWSAFDPGVNTWAFTAASFDPASRLTVMATPAWK